MRKRQSGHEAGAWEERLRPAAIMRGWRPRPLHTTGPVLPKRWDAQVGSLAAEEGLGGEGLRWVIEKGVQGKAAES